MAMKSAPLIESKAKKAMMIPFSRTRVLGTTATSDVVPELLQEAAPRGVEGANGTGLVPVEPGRPIPRDGATAVL
jgi:hypothetical protein